MLTRTVKKTDKLGRIVVPKSWASTLGWDNETELCLIQGVGQLFLAEFSNDDHRYTYKVKLDELSRLVIPVGYRNAINPYNGEYNLSFGGNGVVIRG
jgi:bifunctional DNA-binding transcriptional regulator/antitoxin component of YhaV-PrlF toxin-antitoxin module